MSKHVTYRGVTIDMEALMREHEKTVAIGNMRVNARGDQLGKNASVTRTADQIARDNHRVQQAIVRTGLKGQQPAADESILEPLKANKQEVKVAKHDPKADKKKTKEVELPSGDIIVEDDKNQ